MKQEWSLLFMVVGITAVIRLWNLGAIPPGVNRDEASIGYTAYSLLRTGKDEYGVSWPVSIKSFGDWKLPLYIYASMAPISIVGLTDWSVRIVSVLAGILTVLLTYFLVREAFRRSPWSKSIALLTSFLLAVSPWHIHFSRVASEANVAVFLMVAALWLLFVSFRKPVAIMGSAALFVSTLYTYHGYHVFMPLLLFGVIFLYKSQIMANKYTVFSFGIFLIFSILIFSKTLLHADKTKFSGINIFSRSVIHYQIELPRGEHANALFARVFHNRVIYGAKKILENYVASYGPEFLSLRGGTNNAHNIPLVGNIYLLEWPFLFVGIYRFIQMKQSSGLLFLWWLIVAPVASSFTKDAPHSARMMAILPALQVTMALGVLTFLDGIKKHIKTLASFALAGGYIVSALLYFDAYFVHFPQTNSQDWGAAYKSIARFLSDNERRFDRILFSKPDHSPYIYLAFYQRLDPEILPKKAIRYPETNEGFSHVAQLGKIEFRNPKYPEDLLRPKTLVIDWASDIPENVLSFSRIEKEIKTPKGNPHFILLSSSPGVIQD